MTRRVYICVDLTTQRWPFPSIEWQSHCLLFDRLCENSTRLACQFKLVTVINTYMVLAYLQVEGYILVQGKTETTSGRLRWCWLTKEKLETHDSSSRKPTCIWTWVRLSHLSLRAPPAARVGDLADSRTRRRWYSPEIIHAVFVVHNIRTPTDYIQDIFAFFWHAYVHITEFESRWQNGY